MAAGQFDSFVQPREIEFAFFGFHKRPGKFDHMDELESELFHLCEIAIPLFLRPMLGVVIYADAHQVFCRKEMCRRIDGRHWLLKNMQSDDNEKKKTECA